MTEPVQYLAINCPPDSYFSAMNAARVTAGKTLQFTPDFRDPSDPFDEPAPTNPKLRWWLDARDMQFATVSAAGALKAKAAKTVSKVRVHCETQDGSGLTASMDVYITPPVTAINVFREARVWNPDTHNYDNIRVPCTGKTISLSESSVPHGLGETLYVTVEPAGAVLNPDEINKQIMVSSNQTGVLTVTGLQDDGTGMAAYACAVTALGAGKATVTFAPADGGKKATVNYAITKATDEIKLTLPNGEVLYVNTFGWGGSPGCEVAVAAGKSVQLKAEGAAYDGSDYIPSANKKVTWSLVSGADCVTLSAAGKVTAKAGREWGEAIVRASATDVSEVFADILIRIMPAVQTLDVADIYGAIVTNQTLIVEPDKTYTFRAPQAPAYASEMPLWSANNKNVSLSVNSYDGSCTVVVPDDGKLVKLGSTITLTAASADGAGKKAVVKLKVERLTDNFSITGPNGETGMLYVGAGKGVQLLTDATCYEPGWTPSNKKVKWTLTDGAQYATVSAAGKVTAKAGTVGKTIEVTAETLDGSGITATCSLRIVPAVTSMTIQNYPRQNVTGKTLNIEQGESARFRVQYAPAEPGQSNRFYWTTNHPDVRVTTQWTDGTAWNEVTAGPNVPAGTTVTLTAKATDGSGKTAIVKLKVKVVAAP